MALKNVSDKDQSSVSTHLLMQSACSFKERGIHYTSRNILCFR